MVSPSLCLNCNTTSKIFIFFFVLKKILECFIVSMSPLAEYLILHERLRKMNVWCSRVSGSATGQGHKVENFTKGLRSCMSQHHSLDPYYGFPTLSFQCKQLFYILYFSGKSLFPTL